MTGLAAEVAAYLSADRAQRAAWPAPPVEDDVHRLPRRPWWAAKWVTVALIVAVTGFAALTVGSLL